MQKTKSFEEQLNTKMVVCKFGGTSLANAENIKIVSDIIKKGKKRFVVVSAPGKRDKTDIKVTDLLIECFSLRSKNKDYSLPYEKLKNRFYEIAKKLDVKIDLSTIFESIEKEIEGRNDYDFIISRGEFILAKIIAEFLNYTFLDAKDFLIINYDREVDFKKSKKKFLALVRPDENYVIPGFYGENKKGEIVTFSRGGSDVTGAIIAKLLEAKLYENFTDVDGFYSANPQIVSSVKLKKQLSYDELRALSFFGASVLHPSCVQFLKENNIVLNLKNTFNPSCSGSFILTNNLKKTKSIAGISGQKGFLFLKIKKFDIQSNFSSIRKIEHIFKNYGIRPYCFKISLDQMIIILKKDFSENFSFENFVFELKNKVECESIDVLENIAIVSVVGEAIKNYGSVEQKVFEIIQKSKINLHFVLKDVSNLFIQILIDEKNFENEINFLHKNLFLDC